MEQELKPCPFCGDEATVEQVESDDCWSVGCESCDFHLMTGEWNLGWYRSEEKAVAAWNRRQAASAAPDLTPEERGYVPLSVDGKSVFIDGMGEVPICWPGCEKQAASAAPVEQFWNARGEPNHAALQRYREQKAVSAALMVITEKPIVVDFETDAAKYKIAIVGALLDAGVPITHDDGQLMSTVEQIEWLAKKAASAAPTPAEFKAWIVCDPFAGNCSPLLESFDTKEQAEEWLREKTAEDDDGYAGCVVAPRAIALAAYRPASAVPQEATAAPEGELVERIAQFVTEEWDQPDIARGIRAFFAPAEQK